MDLSLPQISYPLALAIVATLGYLFGRQRRFANNERAARSQRELRRAQSVASELERIALGVRRSLAKHHASINKFKDHVGRLSGEQQAAAWKDLCKEAEEILKPTLQFATEIASAYEEIRHQTNSLMTFTEVRTDPLTSVNNRRGLDDTLSAQFAMMTRYNVVFALAIFDIDHFKQINDQRGHLYGDRILQQLARLLDECVRETDIVARYGGEEFVIVMPQTDLQGAAVLSERLRYAVEQQMSLTVSGGVTMVLDGDTQDSLLARADQALYHAKTAGRNCVFQHTGESIDVVSPEVSPTAV
jgi:diguanylate cyclase